MDRSQGGFSPKVHPRLERSGKPAVRLLVVGKRRRRLMLLDLIKRGVVKRAGRSALMFVVL
ncbi:MAG: hypothetical protein M3Q71_07525 [Chloroflexota bacterium]|nr:hypothetical protein [Chloroflexota bacterium]